MTPNTGRSPRFDREVDAATAKRRKQPGCEERCSWWERGNRVWHTANCPNNPLNNRRVTKGAREMDRQEREAAASRELDSPVYAEREVGQEHRTEFTE